MGNQNESQNRQGDIILYCQPLSVTRRRKKHTAKLRKLKADRQWLIKKYSREKLSCREIAEILGNVTRQCVWKALKRNGIKRRSKEDAIFYENGQRCKIFLGYVWIYNPEHPRTYHKYVKRATINLEAKLNRSLRPEEFAHHIDNNRLNDNPENLLATTHSEHRSVYHSKNGCRSSG